MARAYRTHVMPIGDAPAPDGMRIKALTKQQFGKRLYQMMLDRNLNQSQLAKLAKLSRNQLSTYVRGACFPSPQSLKAVAGVLKVDPDILLPNHMMAALDDDMPVFEMSISQSAPDMVRLRVNRVVTNDTANKLKALLDADRAPEVLQERRKAAGAGR